MSMIDKKKFTVVLLDDDLKSMDKEKTEIDNYLKDKGLEPEWIMLPDGKEIEAILEKNPDLVLIDKNMDEESDGLAVVQKVRQKSELIDILLYSAKGIQEKDFREASKYTAVELVNDKIIADQTQSLIDRNLAKWEDIVFLRGIVISKIIDLELKINSIFGKYFKITGEKEHHFNDLILENSSNSLEGKKKALKRLLQATNNESLYDGLGKLGYLQQQRNFLAHCKVDPDNRNWLISMGEPQKFEKKHMLELFQKIKEISDKIDVLLGIDLTQNATSEAETQAK